jgi:hypothetical protein
MGLYDVTKTMLDRIPASDLELKRIALDLMAQAVEADAALSKAQRRIEELEGAASMREKLVLQHSVYWLPRADGKLDGPFCPACWGTKQQLVPMLMNETAIKGTYWTNCQIHSEKTVDITLRR